VGLLALAREANGRVLEALAAAANARSSPGTLLDDLGRVGEGAPRVVIQGGLSTDAYLYRPLQELLEARGFAVAATDLDFHGYASIPRDAQRLQEVVHEQHAAALLGGGDGRVSIVAHSKGGLAARWLLQRMDGLEQVGQLVTIGTPHHGAAPYAGRAAAAAMGLPGMPAALRQLARDSSLVRELDADLPAFMERARAARPGFRIVSIAGDVDLPGVRGTDGLVSVASAHLDDRIAGVHNVVHRGVGAHHGAVAGQFGMFEPTLRSATLALAGRPVADAAAGAALLAR
jgi:hypothetical protein